MDGIFDTINKFCFLKCRKFETGRNQIYFKIKKTIQDYENTNNMECKAKIQKVNHFDKKRLSISN